MNINERNPTLKKSVLAAFVSCIHWMDENETIFVERRRIGTITIYYCHPFSMIDIHVRVMQWSVRSNMRRIHRCRAR